MGGVFSPELVERYVALCLEFQLPSLFPAMIEAYGPTTRSWRRRSKLIHELGSTVSGRGWSSDSQSAGNPVAHDASGTWALWTSLRTNRTGPKLFSACMRMHQVISNR